MPILDTGKGRDTMNLIMVSTAISLFITIVLPIALILILFIKDFGTIKWAITGGLVFTLFQILTRIPLLNYLNLQPWYIRSISTNTAILALFLAATAGIFEEGGRYIALRWVLRDRMTWLKGIALGIGHGGVEAIYLVGRPLLRMTIQQWSTGNSPLATALPTSILLGGAERLIAMTIHVGLTLMVLYGVKNREVIYFFLAVLFHTLVNLPILLIESQIMIWGYLILWTLIFIYIILKFRRDLKDRWFYNY